MSNATLVTPPPTEVVATPVSHNGRQEPASLISMRDLWKTYEMGSEKVLLLVPQQPDIHMRIEA